MSFLLSARKAYPDQYLKYSPDKSIHNNQLNFTDYNAKMQFVINKKNELTISGYKGFDVFGLGNYFGIDYGNEVLSLHWTHSKNARFYSKTSLAYTNYGYTVKVKNSNSDLLILSSIRNASIKHENQVIKNDKNTFKYGIEVVVHEIKPSSIIASTNAGFNSFDLDVRRNFEGNLFFSHDWKVSTKTSINYGLRMNSFSILGPGNYVSYDSFGNPVKYLSYKLYQIGVPYINPEPRISANIELSKHNYLKLAYIRTAQNIHQVSNSTSNTPIDLFMSSNNNLRPETADQFSAGYFANVRESLYDFSAELYYKSLKNQLDFRNGSQLVANLKVEKQLAFGIGRAYGLELLFKKKTGLLTGWVAYTLSKTERKFSQINNGKWFNARQDRTHELSIVGVYQFSKRWVLSSTWVYYTGAPVTYPVGMYSIAGQNVYYYTDRNGSRMPDYHRLDVSVTYQGKIKSKFESNWTFSIYNAYNRENAYSIDFKNDAANPFKIIATQTTLFKLVPSIVYNFKF